MATVIDLASISYDFVVLEADGSDNVIFDEKKTIGELFYEKLVYVKSSTTSGKYYIRYGEEKDIKLIIDNISIDIDNMIVMKNLSLSDTMYIMEGLRSFCDDSSMIYSLKYLTDMKVIDNNGIKFLYLNLDDSGYKNTRKDITNKTSDIRDVEDEFRNVKTYSERFPEE